MNRHRKNKYKRAFKVACSLLNGDCIYGVSVSDYEDTIFEEMMQRDGMVSSRSYERYILENLDKLTN